MRMTILAAIIAGLPSCVAAAEQPGQQVAKPPVPATPRPVTGNACAAFGPGFVKLPGSSSCVKVGGSVGIDVGVTR